MAIDYADIYSQLYTRVASNSAGAATRALLGSGGLMGSRRALANTAGKVMPWLVWTYGAVSGQSGEMANLNCAWWAYIAPGKDEATLYDIARALHVCYGASEGLAVAAGRIYTGPVGQPFIDSSLGNVQGMQIPLYYRALR